MGTDSKATSKTDIADTIGEIFCHNSSSFNYSESFQKIKAEQEKVKLNFKLQNNEIYNKDFNLDELVEAIQLSHDSATGPDEIHYQMLKHLPENSLETLLNIFNYIWTTGKSVYFYGHCNAVLSVLSSFAIISLKKRGLFALLWLCSYCRQSELPWPIPQNSVESDHECTSRIYFDNTGDSMTLSLYNVTLTSQKPC